MKFQFTIGILLLSLISVSTSEARNSKKFNFKPLAAKKDTCDSAGVYLTQDDFIKRRLSYKVNPNRSGQKMSINQVLNQKVIKINRPDTSVAFKPGSVYGYYQCGERYRYSDKDYFNIVEKSPLVIYSLTKSNFSGVTETHYFYSLTPTSEIKALSLDNIEKDFKSKPAFIQEVKSRFKWYSELGETDENGQFVINALYLDYKYRNE